MPRLLPQKSSQRVGGEEKRRQKPKRRKTRKTQKARYKETTNESRITLSSLAKVPRREWYLRAINNTYKITNTNRNLFPGHSDEAFSPTYTNSTPTVFIRQINPLFPFLSLTSLSRYVVVRYRYLLSFYFSAFICHLHLSSPAANILRINRTHV